MRSAHYSLHHSTFDAGGGVSTSPRYRLVSAQAATGGLARSANARIEDRRGLPGVLNEPPFPIDDIVRRQAGQTLQLAVADLLANDQDPESDRITLRSFSPVSRAGGQITFDAGRLLYHSPPIVPVADAFTYTIEDAAGQPATSQVIVLVEGAAPPPPPNQAALSLLPGNHKRITFTGVAGRRYAIGWADAVPVIRWQLSPFTAADGLGLVEWVDSTLPAPPRRFYRIVAE
jgi:hypothetical protein